MLFDFNWIANRNSSSLIRFGAAFALRSVYSLSRRQPRFIGSTCHLWQTQNKGFCCGRQETDSSNLSLVTLFRYLIIFMQSTYKLCSHQFNRKQQVGPECQKKSSLPVTMRRYFIYFLTKTIMKKVYIDTNAPLSTVCPFSVETNNTSFKEQVILQLIYNLRTISGYVARLYLGETCFNESASTPCITSVRVSVLEQFYNKSFNSREKAHCLRCY